MQQPNGDFNQPQQNLQQWPLTTLIDFQPYQQQWPLISNVQQPARLATTALNSLYKPVDQAQLFQGHGGKRSVPEVPNVNNRLPESLSQSVPQTIRVMHINNRIRVRIFGGETLDELLQKLILFFDLGGHRKSVDVGLMLRNIGGSLSFVNGIEGIKNDSLYYIYYKDGADFTHFNYMKDDKGESQLYQEEMRNNFQHDDYLGIENDYNDAKYQKVLRNGLTLGQVVQKIKRPKEEQRILHCPFQKCLKEFTETGNLKTHMRTHTGERPFACSLCREHFITKGHLQAHELTHTGQKPFVCKYMGCTKRYSRAGRLKIHYQRIHEEENPEMDCVKSDEEKEFLEVVSNNVNQQNKNGRQEIEDRNVKPFLKCDLCNQKFLNGDAYLVHMQNHIQDKFSNPSFQAEMKQQKSTEQVKHISLPDLTQNFAVTIKQGTDQPQQPKQFQGMVLGKRAPLNSIEDFAKQVVSEPLMLDTHQNARFNQGFPLLVQPSIEIHENQNNAIQVEQKGRIIEQNQINTDQPGNFIHPSIEQMDSIKQELSKNMKQQVEDPELEENLSEFFSFSQYSKQTMRRAHSQRLPENVLELSSGLPNLLAKLSEEKWEFPFNHIINEENLVEKRHDSQQASPFIKQQPNANSPFRALAPGIQKDGTDQFKKQIELSDRQPISGLFRLQGSDPVQIRACFNQVAFSKKETQ